LFVGSIFCESQRPDQDTKIQESFAPLYIFQAESMERRSSFDQASAGFRAHLPDLTSPRFTSAAKQNIYEYVKSMRDNRAPPWLYDLTKVWEKLLEEPYKGVTNDGNVREGLYQARDEGFDIKGVVKKAEELLGDLSEEQREKVGYKINAREWRAWSNPEFLLRPLGLRLEEGVYTKLPQNVHRLTVCSTREDGPVNLERHRSLFVARRLPKSSLCYASQPLPG
jgi:hypothetical protein